MRQWFKSFSSVYVPRVSNDRTNAYTHFSRVDIMSSSVWRIMYVLSFEFELRELKNIERFINIIL